MPVRLTRRRELDGLVTCPRSILLLVNPPSSISSSRCVICTFMCVCVCVKRSLSPADAAVVYHLLAMSFLANPSLFAFSAPLTSRTSLSCLLKWLPCKQSSGNYSWNTHAMVMARTQLPAFSFIALSGGPLDTT